MPSSNGLRVIPRSSYVRDTLGISDGTAKAHVAHIYQKLGVHSRNDLLELVEDLLAQA